MHCFVPEYQLKSPYLLKVYRNIEVCLFAIGPLGPKKNIFRFLVNKLKYNTALHDTRKILYTAISIKVVARAKRKSRIRARKAAGKR